MFAVDKKSLNTISLLTITICLIYILCSVVYKDITDDHFFSTALSKYSLLDTLQFRYNTWSGRILIEAFLMKTINIRFLPQIIIALSSLLIAYCIANIASGKSKSSIRLIALSLILLLADFHTNRQATLWITGAYNYIVPITLGMYAISIYLEKDTSLLKKGLSFLFILVACNNEQFAITALIGVAVVLISKGKCRSLSMYDALFTSFLICGGAIVLSAPGNILRLRSEILNWMPDFESYNVFYKLSVGIDRISNQINSDGNFLLVICCGISLIFLLTRSDFCFTRSTIISILTFKILTFLLSFYPESIMTRGLRFSAYISPEEWIHPHVFFSYLINFLVISSILLTCVAASNTAREAVKISTIMVCGVLSVLMIGFSPTAYASGTRVMFIFDISIVIASVFILTKLTSQHRDS